jgi:hypothetical protein
MRREHASDHLTEKFPLQVEPLWAYHFGMPRVIFIGRSKQVAYNQDRINCALGSQVRPSYRIEAIP